MAHSKSAIKRQRQSLRRKERNRARRSEARGAVRRARELIAAGDSEEAQAAVREATKILDRVAGKGTLHRNNAARRKSRLVRALNAAQAAPKKAAPRRRRAKAKASDEGDSEAG